MGGEVIMVSSTGHTYRLMAYGLTVYALVGYGAALVCKVESST